MTDGLCVKIWGTRGSLAAPFSDRMEFGGNTSCVSVTWDDELAIFDCGSGIRALGEELSGSDFAAKKELHIFITHLHLDHISGLPFFPQIYKKDWTIHLYGYSGEDGGFQKKLNDVIQPPYWPVALTKAGAKLCWHEIVAGKVVELPGGVSVFATFANHPDDTVIYRLEKEHVRVVYGLDYELTEASEADFREFVKDSALLIFDGMYTEEELERHRGFGHSSWMQGVQMMETGGVKQLCISHHDWKKTDLELNKLEQAAQERCDRCLFAREGMEFLLK